MSDSKDPFRVLILQDGLDGLNERSSVSPAATAGATATLHGFDSDDQPLLVGLQAVPGEVVAARTIVSLMRTQIGSSVVVVFDNGDPRRPIVLGVLQDVGSQTPVQASPRTHVPVRVDDNRIVLSAEREIVLECGDASITLTRAGKVLIKGTYVVSRSSGYNKIKGAAVDIN